MIGSAKYNDFDILVAKARFGIDGDKVSLPCPIRAFFYGQNRHGSKQY
ncbi:hypothetical protein J31TS3_28480 [Paenibacillus lactis]|nr:hypothetical protein J31TS3_28480 [Paenibacillus lactis]